MKISLSQKRIILAGFLLILGIVAVYLAYSTKTLPPFRGVLIDPPYSIGDFTLQSDQGDIHLSDFQGKVVLLYFGYTYCPDVCPATMADLSQVMEDLGKDSSKVQVIFISVDPDRDTPEELGIYARYFYPDFIGATSTADNIADVAYKFGVYYEIIPAASGENYTIDHTATVWVIDQSGGLYLEWPYGTPSSDMASDLKRLLK
jgi:protein SCO1/2